MYRCMFVMPVKTVSTALQLDEDSSICMLDSEETFGPPSDHEGCVRYHPKGDSDKGMLVKLDSTTTPCYVLGKIPLLKGKYTWKVWL